MIGNSNFKTNPLKRFSNKVENYHKYRPGYPDEMFLFFKEKFGLDKKHMVADIGSGTGMLSDGFLKDGNKVFGVEPNKEMRETAEKRFFSSNKFISLPGTAEKTGIPDNFIDFIFVAQAFHWLDPMKTKEEFQRIIRTDLGSVFIIWNHRQEKTDFEREFEEIFSTYGTDYLLVKKEIEHKKGLLKEFYAPLTLQQKVFNHEQKLDYESLQGLLLSMSYIPDHSMLCYQEMIDDLSNIFNCYQEDGQVVLNYETHLYFGESLERAL